MINKIFLLKSISRFIALLCFFIFVSGCDNAEKDKELIVGTSADNPPYEFIQNGKIIGLDIDIINNIGAHLGKRVIIKNMDFHGLIAALVNKQVDIVISGLSVTPEREARVQFSRPYTNATIAVLYRTDDKIKSTEDLRNKAIGAQLGTIWSKVAQDLSLKYNLKVESLASNLILVERLRSKALDAVILEGVQAEKFIAKNELFGSFLITDILSQFAIATYRNPKLLSNINNSLIKFEEDGTLEKIRSKWLGDINLPKH